MAKQLFANNVSVPIIEHLTAADTTITVSSTAKFPSLGTGDWIMATIVPTGGQGTPEVVKITAISGSNLTVTRGQEGTAAQDFLYGSLLELRVTKGTLEWLRDHPGIINAVTDFGCDNTGATNTTTAMKNFFDACIAAESPGFIPAGDYLITAGVLAFDNGFVDKVWPYIYTAGHEATVFKRADATNSPMISLTNGTASSGAGNYWNGGCIGGITFDQNGKATSPGQHGINLRGVWATEFGWMKGEDLGGSLIHIEPLLFGGTNPDPYAVTFCTFKGVEANRCKLYAFQNENYVGLNGCHIEEIRAISCESGVFFGYGASNVVDFASVGSCAGWAFDDGTNAAATGGAPSRFTLKSAELDDVQNGIRINRTTIFEFSKIRFVHRYNFSSLNPSEGYWPNTAILLAGGASPATVQGSMEIVHRIEAGGTKPEVGALVNLSSSANLTGISIDQRIIDNASFGFVDTDLYTNINVNSQVLLTNNKKVIADTFLQASVLATGDGTTVVTNSGYGTAASKILMPAEAYDRASNYASSQFTAPYSGLFDFVFRFTLNTAADGTRVRLGILRDRATVLTTVAHRTVYSNTANSQTYEITGTVDLVAGDIVYPIADQNTATASIACTPVVSHAAENVFQIRGR